MGLHLNYSNDGSPRNKCRKIPFPYEKKKKINISYITYDILLLYKLCLVSHNHI